METVTVDESHMKQESSAVTAPIGEEMKSVDIHGYSRDAAELARFGKREQLKRNFGIISTIGFTCTVMITWEGFTTAFLSGLANGGPSGLVYGFLFAWIGNALQVLVIAELASMIPIAGGQYNWVSVLAPPSYAKFLSYLTGWMTVISWQAALAGSCFLGGTMIQGLIVLNYESYEFQRWHGTLLLYAVLAVSLFINTYLARVLPAIESCILVIHILGFFAIVITLVYLSPHQSAGDVFAAFSNSAGWSSIGLSFFVGLSTSMFAFIGIDSAGHIAEEIEHASSVIPRSMCYAVLINGGLGLAMCIALLFCLGDINAALATPTGYPFIEVYTSGVRSATGGTAMASVIIAAMIFAAIASLATASRMTWAFAREKGLPGSKYLSQVEKRTALPLYSIGLSAVISVLLGLINIGSATAFNAMVSLIIASFYSSIVVSASVMLHKRLTTPDSEIIWGPFKLGRAGVPVTVLAIIYSLIGIFFSFWPPAPSPTPNTMNWSVAVFGGVVLFCLVFWYLHGRHVYKGPITEIIPE